MEVLSLAVWSWQSAEVDTASVELLLLPSLLGLIAGPTDLSFDLLKLIIIGRPLSL